MLSSFENDAVQEETMLAGHSITRMMDRCDQPLPEGPGRDFCSQLHPGTRRSPRSLWPWCQMPC